MINFLHRPKRTGDYPIRFWFIRHIHILLWWYVKGYAKEAWQILHFHRPRRFFITPYQIYRAIYQYHTEEWDLLPELKLENQPYAVKEAVKVFGRAARKDRKFWRGHD